MTLRGGSTGRFASSLGASIERAFSAQMLTRPRGIQSGPQAVIARDAQGYETFAEVEL